MAELNQFQRSRDRLIEILNQVALKDIVDQQTALHIKKLELAIEIIDRKIEGLRLNAEAGITVSRNYWFG